MASTEPWSNRQPRNLDEARYRRTPPSLIPTWLRAWWPALLWSAMIFFASTDTFSSTHTARFFKPFFRWLIPYLTDEQFNVIHYFLRKSAHFTEYFIFFFFLYRGIRGARQGWRWSWALAAWFTAAAYSALDEIHQSFVASRTASPWDALLDSVGALSALFLLFAVYRFSRPRRA